MSVVERLGTYVNAASQMQQTHKGTPHAANGEPLHLTDLRALLALVTAVESVKEEDVWMESNTWQRVLDALAAVTGGTP